MNCTFLKISFVLIASMQIFGGILLLISFFIEAWLFELLVSYARQLSVVLLLGTAASMVLLLYFNSLKSKPFAVLQIISAVISIVILVFTLQIPVSTLGQNSSETSLRFTTFNKLYSNNDISEITDYFKEKSIDVIALQETYPEEVRQIAENLGYKYTFTTEPIPTARYTVKALISRFPFEEIGVVNLDEGFPVVRAVIDTPETRKTAFYSVHLPGPFSSSWYKTRNIAMKSFADRLKSEDIPVVIGGDFNTTVFSPALRNFNKTLNPTIRPAITSRLPECSWYGYGLVACIRIDHVYLSNDLRLHHFEIAPFLGADHRALVVDISK